MSESLPVVKKRSPVKIVLLVAGLLLVLGVMGYLIFTFRANLKDLVSSSLPTSVIEDSAKEGSTEGASMPGPTKDVAQPFAPPEDKSLDYYSLPDFEGIPDPIVSGAWKTISDGKNTIYVLGEVSDIGSDYVVLDSNIGRVNVEIDDNTVQSVMSDGVQIYNLLELVSLGDYVLVLGLVEDVDNIISFTASNAHLMK